MEHDERLAAEMTEWDATIDDGLGPGPARRHVRDLTAGGTGCRPPGRGVVGEP